VPGYVEEELRGYLERGILCFGFARAICTGCGTGFVVAFSCKGRGVCPSYNGRHMAQTAAHLVDHVIPPVPVRQWVISIPKRLRGFLADRPNAVAALTKIFLDGIERFLPTVSGVTHAADTPRAARPRLGAVSFLHRFGSALNHHVHLDAGVTDGVFAPNHELRRAVTALTIGNIGKQRDAATGGRSGMPTEAAATRVQRPARGPPNDRD